VKIETSREELRQALELCAKLANRKSSQKALRCVRLDAKDGELWLSATDLEEWLCVRAPKARCEGAGGVAADLAELRLFVKEACAAEIALESSADGAALTLAAGPEGMRVERVLKASPLEEWPEWPKAPERLLPLDPAFAKAVREAAPSSAGKDFRRALGCVYVAEGLAVATDGHHLVALPCPSPFAEALLLKPSKLLGQMKGALRAGLTKDSQGNGASWLRVEGEGFRWTAKLSDAQFPDWRQVVPDEKALLKSVSFDATGATELLRAIPALKSAEGALGFRCSAEAVFAGASGEQASFKTGAKFSGGDKFEIELSASNLSRALELGMSELRLSDAFSPALFKGPDGAFMASMPLRRKQAARPSWTMEEKLETQAKETAPEPARTAFAVSSPKQAAPENGAEPFEELFKAAEEAKLSARASYEAVAEFARKLREVHSALKRKERERKSTRELIEKIKAASGF
jgi:DNA polymerase III sliding clamp (beta) subunit (PCNA family)